MQSVFTSSKKESVLLFTNLFGESNKTNLIWKTWFGELCFCNTFRIDRLSYLPIFQIKNGKKNFLWVLCVNAKWKMAENSFNIHLNMVYWMHFIWMTDHIMLPEWFWLIPIVRRYGFMVKVLTKILLYVVIVFLT